MTKDALVYGAIRQRICFLWVAGALLLSGCAPHDGRADESSVRQFQSVYEPSGVSQLPDGRLVVVEDEKLQSISLLNMRSPGVLSSQPLIQEMVLSQLFGKPVLGKVQDLEGVAVDRRGYVYAISSHARVRDGRLDKDRERLVRFRVDGDRLVEPLSVKNVKKKILKKHDVLDDAISSAKSKSDGGFNIEGLSFDPQKEKLLIGLRSPIIEGKAVIAVLNNPAAVFDRGEKVEIGDELIYLDLDKGGIRGIAFDPKLGGYLILSRREDKHGKSFKLWLWDGDTSHDARRVKLSGAPNLDHAEGISPVRFNGVDQILIVVDDGNTAARKGGHYILLDYEQLKIESR
jgi:hypothetical protein